MKRPLVAFIIGLLVAGSSTALAVTPVDLGAASSFAILAGSAVSNTGSSLVTGNLGLTPGTAVSGFPPGTLNGSLYVAEGVSLQAQNDLITAYNDAAGRTPVTTVATELGGTTLTAGVYHSASGTFGVTGTLTLDAQNDPGAVFIFQMETSLITATSSQIVMIRGAQPCNVFWQVGSSATLGTHSSFCGNILALSSITVTTGVRINGRVLARDAAVTLDTDTIAVPVCATAADEVVTLIPDNPSFPGSQNVHVCAQLLPAVNTQVIVPVLVSQNIPVISIIPGCVDCDTDECTALDSWTLGDWTFVSGPAPYYVATLTAAAGTAGGCVCISLDYILPVTLLSFGALSEDQTVQLTWTTASEFEMDYFEIVRDGRNVALVDAANSATGSHYRWTDESVQNGTTYTYGLVAVAMNGNQQGLGSASATPAVNAAEVSDYALLQNFPNPFNPTTRIALDLLEGGLVSLTVYNLMGQEVAALVNGGMEAGRHIVSFDAANLPSGVYLYRLSVNGFVAQKKMLLMK